MNWLQQTIDYGVIGLLVLMSFIAMAIAIERHLFYRAFIPEDYTGRQETEIALTRRLHLIATIGSNAPYIGLLGTVLGIMLTFYKMGESGVDDTGSIMTGLALALKAQSSQAPLAWQDLLPVLYFAVGALIMRGAGCTLNDIVDRDFDAKVARTALRPIPAGQVTVKQAALFLGLLLLAGLLILLQFNSLTVTLGIASLALVVTYPFMKRITYWPQAWLGLTFNWGALMGWTAVTGSLSWPPLLLYAGGIAWTLGYDTIYAHQDKEDDALIGVKSTALKLGDSTKAWLVGFYALALIFMGTAGWLIGLNWIFLLALAAMALQMTWQVVGLRQDDPADCLRKFHSNRILGWIYLIGIVAAGLRAL